MPKPRRSATAGAALLAFMCAVLLLPAMAPAATKRPVNVNAHVSVKAHVALGYTQLAAKHRKRPKAHIGQAGCPGASLVPSAGNLNSVRAAILCLTNEARTKNGLPGLRENARLRGAATAHSTDMVERRFFDHTSPGGATMVDRIFRARYARHDQGWAFGENIAWGTGRLSTPQGVFEGWMRSSGHRANILRRTYREVGIGVMSGVPIGGSAGATYTSDFGVRR